MKNNRFCDAALVVACILLALTGCGGQSNSDAKNPPNFYLNAEQTSLEAGGRPIAITVKSSGTVEDISWSIPSGIGSLSASKGVTVEYMPPPFGSISQPSEVKVLASANGMVREILFTVKPNSVGLYPYVGSLGGVGSLDGNGENARFNFPLEIVADENDFLYVLDKANHLIRRIDVNGKVDTYGPFDELNVPDGSAPWYQYRYFSGRIRFASPTSLPELLMKNGQSRPISNATIPEFAAYRDINGDVYTLGGLFKDRRVIFKNHEILAGTFDSSSVQVDGDLKQARFINIDSFLVWPNEQIYLLDSNLQRDKLSLRTISPNGTVSTLVNADFDPSARLIPNCGALPCVLDRAGLHKLLSTGQWNTVSLSNSGLVPAKNPEFLTPDATADHIGNVFLTDPIRNRIVKVSAQGEVSVWAGMSSNAVGEILDGSLDQAKLSEPQALSRDSGGNIFVLEKRATTKPNIGFYNDPIGLTLRKISPDGKVTTLAAPGVWWGKSDTSGVAESFALPASIAVDRQGNLYLLERTSLYGGSIFYDPSIVGKSTLSKISREGVVTRNLIPVNTFYRFDGASLQFDSEDRLLVQDDQGIRRINVDGSVSVLLEREQLSAFAIDKTGNLIFSDATGLYQVSSSGQLLKLGEKRARSIAVDRDGAIFYSVKCELRKLNLERKESILLGVENQCGNRLGDARLSLVNSILTSDDRLLYIAAGNAVLRVVK